MADTSFAPSGGLKGFFGAHNYGIETEKSLQDMLMRQKQGDAYDMQRKLDQFKYDKDVKDEQMLGDQRRQHKLDEMEQDRQKWLLENQGQRSRNMKAASEASIEEMKADLAFKQRRMDAIEQAALLNRQRSQGQEGALPPSPLDGSLRQIQQILKDGGWEATEPWFDDPVSLVDTLERGYQAAQVDKSRLAERRKQLDELEKIRTREQAKPDPSQRLYSPAITLADYAKRSKSWNDQDKDTVRMLLDQEKAKLRAEIPYDLNAMSIMSDQKISPEDRQKRLAKLYALRANAAFGSYYRALGETPPNFEQEFGSDSGQGSGTPAPKPVSPEVKAAAQRILDKARRGEKVDPTTLENAKKALQQASGGSIR